MTARGMRGSHARDASTSGLFAAHDLQHGPGDIRRISLRREEYIGRGELLRLHGSPHRIVLAESGDRSGVMPASEGFSGVHTGPGATALTRMPRSDSSSADSRPGATWCRPANGGLGCARAGGTSSLDAGRWRSNVAGPSSSPRRSQGNFGAVPDCRRAATAPICAPIFAR